MHEALRQKELLCRLRRDTRRKFGRGAGLVVDDHQQIEIADHGRGAGSLLDIRAPLGIMAALRGFFRRPDVERAAGAVFAGNVVLADEFLIGPPLDGGWARILQNLFASSVRRIFELDVFDDHRSASLSLLLLYRNDPYLCSEGLALRLIYPLQVRVFKD